MDPLAFGVFVVLAVEVAQIHPPFGINLYALIWYRQSPHWPHVDQRHPLYRDDDRNDVRCFVSSEHRNVAAEHDEVAMPWQRETNSVYSYSPAKRVGGCRNPNLAVWRSRLMDVVAAPTAS